ncbi:hypothetical protein ACSDQ9_00225 [Aestuariimicrobium soli]|uniref:hypothetical protein n=1 Tax=Aestuariimicrobium soli TaxID=2035834 RepID=UPI003EB96F9C
MIVHHLDGCPVRLRQPCDLSWVADLGTVFAVFDEQDSGNLCLGVTTSTGERLFGKYAGAATTEYEGTIADAVARLRHAGEVFEALAHPSLVRLRERRDAGLTPDGEPGHLLVFDWTDAVPLGRQYGRAAEVRALPVAQRVDLVTRIIEFHVQAADRGWQCVDLYDGSVMVDLGADPARLVLCDVDMYQRAPLTNTMGRMWGSTRFMAPEEFTLGAALDERTTVFTLGSLAHALLGDSDTKARGDWEADQRRFDVCHRARSANRAGRHATAAELLTDWIGPDLGGS